VGQMAPDVLKFAPKVVSHREDILKYFRLCSQEYSVICTSWNIDASAVLECMYRKLLTGIGLLMVPK
jgi:hypothetical protein